MNRTPLPSACSCSAVFQVPITRSSRRTASRATARPTPPPSPVDQDRGAGREVELVEHVHRGRTGNRQRRRHGRGQTSRDARGVRRGQHRRLGVGAATGEREAEDRVTHFEPVDQARARDVVKGIHAGDTDPDQHLVATGDGIGAIEGLLHLRPAIPAETPRRPIFSRLPYDRPGDAGLCRRPRLSHRCEGPSCATVVADQPMGTPRIGAMGTGFAYSRISVIRPSSSNENRKM